MAVKAPKFGFFLALFCILFLLVSSKAEPEVKTEGKPALDAPLCERASQTFSGTCKNTDSCDNKCRTWEHAVHGACHVRKSKHMCFCYFTKC